jgi:hypothetical protein
MLQQSPNLLVYWLPEWFDTPSARASFAFSLALPKNQYADRIYPTNQPVSY